MYGPDFSFAECSHTHGVIKKKSVFRFLFIGRMKVSVE